MKPFFGDYLLFLVSEVYEHRRSGYSYINKNTQYATDCNIATEIFVNQLEVINLKYYEIK